MDEMGHTWMPGRDKRDNKATNYDSNANVEVAYQKKVKDYEDTMRWFESLYEPGEEIDADEYIFLKLPLEEKMKAPDSDFIYEGLHKSMMPVIICSDRESHRNVFKRAHKSNWLHWRVRVPSMKRDNATWRRFYNMFPDIAAEVRLGTRRYVNGAKCKYIW